MTIRLAAKHRWLGAAALVLMGFGSYGLATAATTPANCNRCFAQVRADGLLTQYRGISGNFRRIKGSYIISFKYPIDKCAISASFDAAKNSGNLPGNTFGPLTYRNSDRTINVIINDVHFSPVDSDFSLVVTC